MDYIKIKFTKESDQLSSDTGRGIEDMFRSMSPFFALPEGVWKPQMDIYETDEEIIILAEIAGVDKENLSVEINTRAAKIYGERTEMPRLKNSTYRLAEIQYGRFERILFLPAPIDADKVIATYFNGLLQIRLAKLPPDRTHRIPIVDG
ncbi:MAG: Hsp20/alpha crystallin family protein [Desulfobacterales bacterium]|uniref:Hsp20/alpha crystallin family protein n=1 Tax=Candidatus Desulfaltia bathyphila TaxID=2841697 RepID=A0A8J6N3Q5_9BACT|nr:Hsp20/alpha crystallin family protein [Candidatus Desulfaltia bathyphila]MBL7194755.1 Hsp20/alpha crystallin family protein [Desulfobacterales bacterium]MBL7208324.1 Hsp20/alpha crystallin family protein [Desulfobacterales bacterium]